MLLTLREISEQTEIPYSTLGRYVRMYGEYIPRVEGRGRRLFPTESLAVFQAVRSGWPPVDREKYLTLTDISNATGISFPKLVRLFRLAEQEIPHVTRVRRRLFPQEAVEIFEELAGIKRGNRAVENISLLPIDPHLLRLLSQDPELLKIMPWRKFERVLAEILSRLGYEIELQRGTKDGGIDIFALKHEGAFGLHRYLLQAKRWSTAVGVAPVRELMFLHDQHRVYKSCLATTSRFTAGAWRLGEEFKWQLELKDLELLHQWVIMALRAKS